MYNLPQRKFALYQKGAIQGLLHISEIAHERIDNVEDILKVGDQVDVKLLKIEHGGRLKLSRKALLDPPKDKANDSEE